MPETLEQILADARGAAQMLRFTGNTGQAEYLEGLCTRVAAATEEWLTWLSETDAAVRSGRTEDWLRGRFEALRRDGHARLVGRRIRQYRACAIPRRANVVAAANRGREAARKMKRSA